MKALRLQAGFWVAVALLVLAAAAFLLLPLPEPWHFAPKLKPGSSSPFVLDGKERHEYLIPAGEGQLLNISVEQQGTDVALELFTSSGEPWLEVDSPTGAEGIERIVAVAPIADEYRLSVREAGDGLRGRYVLGVEPLRLPTPRDLKLAALVLALSDADRLGPKEALPKYREVLRLSREAGDLDRHAFAQRRLGYVLADLEADDQALKCLSQASEELRVCGYRLGEAVVLDKMGWIRFDQGDLRSALELRQRSLGLYREVGGDPGRSGQVTVLNNIALIHKYWGKLDEARHFYREVLDRWPPGMKPEYRAVVITNVGELFLDLKQPEEALSCFDQAIVQLQSDPARQARALAGRGIAHSHLGKADQALSDLQEALELARGSGDVKTETSVLNRLGEVATDQKQAKQAVTLLLDALDRSRRSRDLRGEAQALAQLGGSYLSLGAFGKALGSFDESSKLYRQFEDRSGLSSTLFGAAQVKHAVGELDQAQVLIEDAIAIVEDLRKEPLSPMLRAQHFSRRDTYYQLLLAVLMDRAAREPGKDFEARAFEVSERARARTMLEELAGSRVGRERPLDPGTLESEQKLKDSIQRRWEQPEPGSDPEADREAEALERKIQEQAADRALRVAGQDAVHARSQPLTLKEIQQQVLDEQTLLLTFSLGEDRSHLFLIGPHSIQHHPLPSRLQIEERAENIAAELARKTPNSFRKTRQDLGALSQILLLPIADEIRGKRLLIVPDGDLHSVPFAALPDPGSLREDGTLQDGPRGKWDYRALVDSHTLNVLPSASVLAALRRTAEERPPAPLDIAVLGDPVFEKDDPRVLSARSPRSVEAGERDLTFEQFQRLRFSEEEAMAIVEFFPPERRLLALAFSAERNLLLRGGLDRYRILHFATHGVLDSQPELSGLVFSQVDEKGREIEGFLPAFEISRLNLPCELVVLSACQTGAGEVVPGEGVMNLSRSFLGAGAQRVVGTLWNVNDQATSHLMIHFYRAMSQGSSPSEALRAAQIATRNDDRWASPYYWAGFVLQGEW